MDLDFHLIATVLLWAFAVFAVYSALRICEVIKGREGSLLDKLYRAFSRAIEDISNPIFDFLTDRWKERREYTDFNPKYWFTHFLITRAFTTRSLMGFKIQYELDLICKRQNAEEYKAARMLDDSARQQIAEEYHKEVFCGHFKENRYVFYFGWRYTPEWPEYEVVRTPVGQLVEVDDDIELQEVLQTRLNVDLHPILFHKYGCELQLGSFRNHIFPDHLIEENYAMLSNEEIKEVEDNHGYGELVERIAVVALKRRLEFLGKQSSQKHEAERFLIQTEKAGRVVRIRWQRKSTAPQGYELVGYRRTEGFNEELYTNNGMLVVHSQQDGEIIETLADAESYFYTFFLQSKRADNDGSRSVESPLRFQLATSAVDELAAIDAILGRVAARKPPPDPEKEHISRALKELGLYAEFDKAMETTKRSLAEQIRSSGYTAEEKEDKLTRLDDFVNTLRMKYEP